MKKISIVLADITILNLCYIASFYLRFWGQLPSYNFKPYLILAPLVSLIVIILFNVYGLYETIRKTWSEVVFSISCSIGLLTMFGMALAYFSGGYAFPRSVFLISPALQIAAFTIYRYGIWKLEKLRHGTKEILLIGYEDDLLEVIDKLEKDSLNIHRIKGLIIGGKHAFKVFDSYPVYEGFDDCQKVLVDMKPDEVIVGPKVRQETKDIILKACLKENISLYFVPDTYDIFVLGANLVQIDDIPLFQIQPLEFSEGYDFLKRIADIVLSLCGIILIIPFVIFISILVKLDSQGPVFFKQERISEQGKVFKLIKFRTMVHGAEDETGPVLAVVNDSRVTRLGKFLRATRLDEAPQLYNVLVGDMSLVGPRPERPFFVDRFISQIPDYTYRQRLKSGITGLAQVAGKYSTTPEDKLRYDLLYAKKASILFDLKILFQTIKVILMKHKSS